MKSTLLKVTTTGGFSVALEYADGLSASLDLAPTLWGEACEPLKDEAVFNRVTLEGNTVVWPNGFDICPDVLRFWAEMGRVVSQEEADEYFSELHQAKLSMA